VLLADFSGRVISELTVLNRWNKQMLGEMTMQTVSVQVFNSNANNFQVGIKKYPYFEIVVGLV
jgi:hypothetical protein